MLYFTEGKIMAVNNAYLVLDEPGIRAEAYSLAGYCLNSETHFKNPGCPQDLSVGQRVQIGYVPVNRDNIAVTVDTDTAEASG